MQTCSLSHLKCFKPEIIIKAHFPFLAYSISHPDPLKSRFLLNGITKETTLSEHLCSLYFKSLTRQLANYKRAGSQQTQKHGTNCSKPLASRVREMWLLESGLNLREMAAAKIYVEKN